MFASLNLHLRLALCGAALLLLAACGSSRETTTADTSDQSDEVHIGYGTQERSDVTGSVSSVTDEDIEESPTMNIQQLLRSRVPGVFVSVAPGGGLKVRIRGTNSIYGSNEPLFVVDGVPMAGGPGGVLSTINVRDIASIDVLKDASSTAIYGTRGANGVVIITTKRGLDD